MGKNIIDNNKYLSIVPFHKLINWSVQYLTNTKIGFTTAYPMVRIGDFLKRNKTSITISDKKEYVRVKIKTHNGGVERREKKNVFGKDIGTKKQYVISEGQFIISKIDARNGAMGIVPKELEGAIVTQDFLPYDINTDRINPNYLVLVSTTKPFLEFCQSCSSGTTNRQRINEGEFLDIKIPVPSLEEQEIIANNYYMAINLSKSKSGIANSINLEILDYVTKQLGIEQEKVISKKQKIVYCKFSKIQRWDIWNIHVEKNSSTYKMISLNDVIILHSGLFLPKSKQKGNKYAVYGGNGLTGYHDDYCYYGKRIVIGRVGEYCGNVHLIDGYYWITDNAFKVDLIRNDITWEYLSIVLVSLNLNKYKSISAQPSLSQSNILQLKIPLPPLKKQNEIVHHVSELSSIKEKYHLEAENIRLHAIKEFETKIFM